MLYFAIVSIIIGIISGISGIGNMAEFLYH